jgi:hypothetical protein
MKIPDYTAKYEKCPDCGMYVFICGMATFSCPRCENGWESANEFGLTSLSTFKVWNYWVVSVTAYSDTWGWSATAWLETGECIQIKKVDLKSFAGCKASFTLFAKKYGIEYFEFE